MPAYFWKVTATKSFTRLAAGMWVDIIIQNATRKPIQREVIEAFNEKYGAGTAPNGISLSNFEMVKG